MALTLNALHMAFKYTGLIGFKLKSCLCIEFSCLCSLHELISIPTQRFLFPLAIYIYGLQVIRNMYSANFIDVVTVSLPGSQGSNGQTSLSRRLLFVKWCFQAARLKKNKMATSIYRSSSRINYISKWTNETFTRYHFKVDYSTIWKALNY